METTSSGLGLRVSGRWYTRDIYGMYWGFIVLMGKKMETTITYSQRQENQNNDKRRRWIGLISCQSETAVASG